MAAKPNERPLVVDANVVISAMLRDGTTRMLLVHGELDLYAPSILWDELERHSKEIVERAALPDSALDLLLHILKGRIKNVPVELLEPFLDETERRLDPDTSDAPYVAAAIAIGGAVWSHDKNLAKKAGVRVWSTAELVKFVG